MISFLSGNTLQLPDIWITNDFQKHVCPCRPFFFWTCCSDPSGMTFASPKTRNQLLYLRLVIGITTATTIHWEPSIVFYISEKVWKYEHINWFVVLSHQIILSMVENKTNPFGMIFLSQLSPCLPKSIPPAANTHQAKHLAAGLSWFSDMHSLNFITHSAIQNVVSLNQFLFKFCVPSYWIRVHFLVYMWSRPQKTYRRIRLNKKDTI